MVAASLERILGHHIEVELADRTVVYYAVVLVAERSHRLCDTASPSFRSSIDLAIARALHLAAGEQASRLRSCSALDRSSRPCRLAGANRESGSVRELRCA